ncbi:hypothetical protein H12S4_44080 [Bradyrhizobium diazoefficiens]|nr:hypothetical protein H12S4_44080 [Bradyrhizobium diazoefficiens]
MPKTFVSYSWSTKAHEAWVLDLATALRESGVDVVLDKWDLKEGHDVVAFMERMGTDKEIDKVIMVFDRRYVEKANDRSGGVGTEAQIITSQIYDKSDQDKFIGVIAQVDPEGKPYKPLYYASRLHLDLSNADIYAENFDQLLRWLFGKPAYPKPALGKAPEFLNDNSVVLPTRSRAQRSSNLLRTAAPGAIGALNEYLESLSDGFEELRIEGSNRDDFDEEVVKSISAFIPYRDEYLGVLAALARAPSGEDGAIVVKRFFERLIPFLTRPEPMMSWSEHWFDNFRFIIHELFLYTVADEARKLDRLGLSKLRALCQVDNGWLVATERLVLLRTKLLDRLEQVIRKGCDTFKLLSSFGGGFACVCGNAGVKVEFVLDWRAGLRRQLQPRRQVNPLLVGHNQPPCLCRDRVASTYP